MAVEAAERFKTSVIWIEPTIDEIELSCFYNTIDLLCHANKIGETFGNTIAEAMIHEKPVISIEGTKGWPQAQYELINNDQLVVSRSNRLQENFEYMKLILSFDRDPHRARHIGRMNKLQSNFFNYKTVAEQFINVYQTLLRGES